MSGHREVRQIQWPEPSMWAISILLGFNMPNDNSNTQPDGDSLGPEPPSNPVEFAKWVQRTRVNPKKLMVRPYDSALLQEPLENPEANSSVVIAKTR